MAETREPAGPERDDSRQIEATQFLQSAVDGDQDALGKLFPLVYDELRALAAGHLAGERDDHTLQPTALVHEVYARLIDTTRFEYRGRGQFFALASRAMRRVLVDHARGVARIKRGGAWKRVALDPEAQVSNDDLPDLVELDRALELLADNSPRQAQVVELRFFGGLELDAVAETLDISRSTVDREWRVARAWLAFTLQNLQSE
jgi:RNA polymerase sigma factor (TIGR02999 family)